MLLWFHTFVPTSVVSILSILYKFDKNTICKGFFTMAVCDDSRHCTARVNRHAEQITHYSIGKEG